jgi:hypothetical protein
MVASRHERVCSMPFELQAMVAGQGILDGGQTLARLWRRRAKIFANHFLLLRFSASPIFMLRSVSAA